MITGRVLLGSSKKVVLPHVERTETFAERTKGLLGRKKIQEGHGLLITQCNSIHTFFMQMVIDVIFLNRDGAIVALKPDLGPYRFAMSSRASAVLELMAGQIAISNLRTGEQLIWEAAS